MTTLCGAETEANALVTALLAGKDFTLPDVDLSDAAFDFPTFAAITPPAPLTNDLLTTKTVGGTGTFDVIMSSILVHLGAEFDKGRITGEQYTKAYIELTSQSLQGAIQYLTVKDAAFWGAIKAQYEANIAQAQLVEERVKLEIAKANLAAARLEAANQEAAYALTKIKVATEEVQYCSGKYTYDFILPAQKTLVLEQGESVRAQTKDTRSDGSTVVGVLGKQKDLFTQQIDSYKRDAETKAAKLFTDAWITQKTIDEGLLPPGQFSNANIDIILNRMRVNLGLNT